MNFQLTIKGMVNALMGTGVAVVLILAGAGYLSNEKLVESQNRLTALVLPLEEANQNIRLAMAWFIERQGRIIGTNSAGEIEHLSDRTSMERTFNASLLRIRSLSSEQAAALRELDTLGNIYRDKFLDMDSAIVGARRKSISLKSVIDQQIVTVDQLGAELQKNAEAVSGRINFAAMREKIALRQYVATQDKTRELESAVTDLLRDDLTQAQKACNDLRLGVATLATNGRQVLLTSNQESIADIQNTVMARSGEMVSGALGVLEKGLNDSPELLSLLQTIRADFVRLTKILEEVGESRRQWLSEESRMAGLRESLDGVRNEITQSLDRLQTITAGIRASAETEAVATRTRTQTFVLAAGTVSVLIMILIGRLALRRIIHPINRTLEFADAIANGDLTARIADDEGIRFLRADRDEVGMLVARLTRMAQNLNSLIGQIQRSGMQVTSSATELAATSKEQEAIVNNQMESTTYVIRAVGDISNIARELVQTMQQVAAMSNETAEYANKGQTDLTRMAEAIRQMEDASKSVSGKLEAINEKATNITSVVTTITKVADQTNLLSLNAAIEAEKAGEYGRGFTVVAREIRRLADQTSVATLDIEKMVQGMQTAVSAGVMEMEAFIKEVRNSAEDVARISTQLKRIIDQVQALSPSFDSVVRSMTLQADSAQEIDGALADLGKEMQQTMSSLKESFEAIGQLNEAAAILQDEVSRFRVA